MCVGLPGHSLSRRRRESFEPGLIFLVLFASRQKEHKPFNKYYIRMYLLSFACPKESNKEKGTGNDIQPLPDAVI
jgi:hypothetical protein